MHNIIYRYNIGIHLETNLTLEGPHTDQHKSKQTKAPKFFDFAVTKNIATNLNRAMSPLYFFSRLKG